MIPLSKEQVDVDPKAIKRIEFGLFVFITVALCLKFRLIFQININQDEFAFLSKIYSYNRGALTGQFQTFHVHFFRWIPYFSKNEVTQIIIARSVMYLFFLGTCLLTYFIGKRFISRSGALFAVICFLSFSFVVVNGSGFRADTISALFCVLSIYLIVSRYHSKFAMITAGLSIAFSLMITIKSVFHLLTIGAIFLCIFMTEQNRWENIKQLAHFLIAFVIGYFFLYQFHIYTLHQKILGEPSQFLRHTSSKVIVLHKFFPGWKFLNLSIYQNLIIWILLIAGIIFVIWTIRVGIKDKTRDKMILLTFLFPIFSLVFYRNSFPYFYVFILTPAIIFCGVAFHEVIGGYKKTGSRIYSVLAIVLAITVFFNFLFYYLLFSPNRNLDQRALLQNIHKIFPRPVAYIDGCSMVASFPKVGFFMSSWGMENYLRANKPIMKNILIKQKPQFLLANVPHLNLSLPRKEAVSATGYALLVEDWNILKSNFLHYWGPIYVIGKQFEFNSISDSHIFEILIPGEYTLEGKIAVSVNGILYKPGDIINLKKGKHTITASDQSGKAALRKGKHLYLPTIAPPSQIFYGPFL